MKKCYKIIARLLVIALIFANQGMAAFADSIDELIEDTTEPAVEEVLDEEETEVEDEVEEPEIEEELEPETEEELESETEDELEPEEDEEAEEESDAEVEEEFEETNISTDSEASEEVIDDEDIDDEELEAEEDISLDDLLAALNDASPSEVVVDEMLDLSLFGGTVDVDETIILDFGHTPRFDKTNNWTGSTTGIAAFTENIDPVTGSYTYEITGGVGDPIATTTFNGTDAPTEDIGAGLHIKLPQYDTGDSAIWSGFKFVGWLDKDGQNLIDSQAGNFKYAYQYGTGTAGTDPNDTTYTASWKQLETVHNLKIHYMRSTASVPTIDGAYEFFAPKEYTDKKHSKFLYEGIKSVPGYKPDSYIIKVNDVVVPDTISGVTIAGRGLKTIDAYGEYFEYDTINDLKVNSEFALEGNMPNHDIEIFFFYVPDDGGKSVFEVNYQSVSGTEIKASRIESTLAEDIIEAAPDDVPNYVYKEAILTTGGQSITTGLYALGQAEFSLPDQVIVPSPNTIPATNPPYPADMGYIKAMMPNQDVKIVYKYEMTDGYDDIVFNVGKEQPDGSLATVSETIHTHVSSSETYDYIVHNLENLGYGAPVITPYDVAIRSYSYNSGIGQPDSTLQYYLTDFGDCVVDITYYYDYTSRYWTKVNFNFKSRADGGHGDIAAATGTKSLDERFFKRGGIDSATEEYIVAELIDGVDINTDTYYVQKVYKCSASLEPIGSPLALDEVIAFDADVAQYGLYIAFEEDPVWWRDINYQSSANCTLDGISSTHITKDSLKVNIASPSVIASAGYKWEGAVCVDTATRKYQGGIWLDEVGNPMPDSLITVLESETAKNYHPSIVVDANPYAGAVRPVSSLVVGANGKGIARPFSTYNDRAYVLADATDKVIESKLGTELSATGFENLMPGHSYHIYEVKNPADVPAISATITASGSGESATISAYYEVNVPSITNNYSVSGDGKSITITAVSGVQYALLSTSRAVVKNFGEPFTNLDEAPYYIVVARSNGESSSATDAAVIKNGVPVYTDIHDLSSREYRLVVMGSGVSVTGKSGTNISGGKVYKITAGTTIELVGATGKSWEVVSNNVSLTSYTSSRPKLTMPYEDVIVRNFDSLDIDTDLYTIDMSGSNGVGLADKETLATSLLQNDAKAVDAVSRGLKVTHYVVLKKTCALSDLSGKLTPYEYTLDVCMSIQGSPYPYTSIDPYSNSSYLKSYVTFDKGVQGNIGYEGLSDIYTESDEKLKGSGTVTLESSKKYAYKQIQSVVVKSSSDATFNKTFYVDFDALLTTATNYSELEAKLQNYWVPTNPSAGSTFNDVEYIYDRTVTDDSSATIVYATATNIKKDYNLKIYHNVNQEREDNKILLRDELSAANTKLSTLHTSLAIASLSNAIDAATTVKNSQRSYTATQIYDAYMTLKNAVDTAHDEASPPGTAVTINIDANGGTANVTSIVVTVGATYSELRDVVVSRDGYTLIRWNGAADGTGVTIDPLMIVDDTVAPETLYAIWASNYTPSPRRVSGGGGGGGGGGGRGGNTITASKGAQLDIYPTTNPTEFSKNIAYRNLGVGFSNVAMLNSSDCIFYNDNKGICIFDNAGKLLINQWISLVDTVGTENRYRTYRLDEYGHIRTGFYTEGDEVYYLSKASGDNYGTVQVGWIYDVDNNSFYYCSPYSGAVITGWLNVDGKDYYFSENKSYDANGKLDINAATSATSGYGKMLSNCMTPDGHMLDANGARVVMAP